MARMLTIPEVGGLLKVPETTIRRWIQQGEFPCTVRNGTPLVNQATLVSWAEAKHLRINDPGFSRQRNEVADNLLAALRLGNVHYDLKGTNKEEVLQLLPTRLHLPRVSPERLGALLLEREQLATTALGNGVAVPHPRYPLALAPHQSHVYVFFLSQAIDWQAPDGKPVHTLFLLLSAESAHHLKILSQLAGLLRQAEVEDFLRHAPSHDELLDFLQTRLAR